MKKVLTVVLLVCFIVGLGFSFGYAYDWEWGRDSYGHPTKYKNYWNDRDGDGVPNYNDRRDDNPNIW